MATAVVYPDLAGKAESGSSISEDKNSDMLLDSFSPIGFPEIDHFKEMLPRRKKRKAKLDMCGLSSTSWVFLTSAFLQGLSIISQYYPCQLSALTINQPPPPPPKTSYGMACVAKSVVLHKWYCIWVQTRTHCTFSFIDCWITT